MAILFNPPLAAYGRANVLLRATARRHFVREFPGPLSIKWVRRGSAVWRLPSTELRADAGTFAILNAGEAYSLEIDSPDPVSTCCVFFEDGFVESVARSLCGGDEASLDNPTAKQRVEFVARVHTGHAAMLGHLGGLAACHSADPLGAAERLLALARDVVLLDAGARREMARVPAVKASTRAEIYRRLQRAREFLHANLDSPVHLAGLAAAASMAPFHFHRAFTAVFRETPREYVLRERLERARRLLAGGSLAVTEVSALAGYESLGSFSSAFRRRFGIPPSAARR